MANSSPYFRSERELPEISFELVRDRINDKLGDYERYAFASHQTKAFNIFFDLAQEFDSVADLLAVAVQIIHTFFNLHAEVYVFDERGKLGHRFCSFSASCPWVPFKPDSGMLSGGPFEQDSLYCIPIRGKQIDQEMLPIKPMGDVLGVLALHIQHPLSSKMRMYFEKFANRMGYQLHNRLLALKHREHLEFVKNLVHDIGHNVIVPNMYFKLLFKQLDGKMQAMRDAIADFDTTQDCYDSVQKLEYIQQRMDEQYQEVYRHFQQTSLFLETLLRQSHFESGHYVLHKTTVELRKRILGPQLERFQGRFYEKGIAVYSPCLEQEEGSLTVTVDVGLISQVIANLFSNAVKYTRDGAVVADMPTKHIRCSARKLSDFYGLGNDAVRIEVFTTGPSIDPEDSLRLFEADFRGGNVGREYGTGHGLFFVREIVELHGGIAGHESESGGNCFFVILPCCSSEELP